jgi:hypothetical protein
MAYFFRLDIGLIFQGFISYLGPNTSNKDTGLALPKKKRIPGLQLAFCGNPICVVKDFYSGNYNPTEAHVTAHTAQHCKI